MNKLASRVSDPSSRSVSQDGLARHRTDTLTPLSEYGVLSRTRADCPIGSASVEYRSADVRRRLMHFDLQRVQAFIEFLDPFGGRSAFGKFDGGLGSPESIAEHGADMPGHHAVERDVTAGEPFVAADCPQEQAERRFLRGQVPEVVVKVAERRLLDIENDAYYLGFVDDD